MAAVLVPSRVADARFTCISLVPLYFLGSPIFKEENRKDASCSVSFQFMKPKLTWFDTVLFSFPRVNHW